MAKMTHHTSGYNKKQIFLVDMETAAVTGPFLTGGEASFSFELSFNNDKLYVPTSGNVTIGTETFNFTSIGADGFAVISAPPTVSFPISLSSGFINRLRFFNSCHVGDSRSIPAVTFLAAPKALYLSQLPRFDSQGHIFIYNRQNTIYRYNGMVWETLPLVLGPSKQKITISNYHSL